MRRRVESRSNRAENMFLAGQFLLCPFCVTTCSVASSTGRKIMMTAWVIVACNFACYVYVRVVWWTKNKIWWGSETSTFISLSALFFYYNVNAKDDKTFQNFSLLMVITDSRVEVEKNSYNSSSSLLLQYSNWFHWYSRHVAVLVFSLQRSFSRFAYCGQIHKFK